MSEISLFHVSVLFTGEEDKEGRCRGKVRHALRSIPEEDGQEDRNFSAREVRVLLLRQGKEWAIVGIRRRYVKTDDVSLYCRRTS